MIRVHVLKGGEHVLRIGSSRIVLHRPAVQSQFVEPETTPIPVISMRDLIYGGRAGIRRAL